MQAIVKLVIGILVTLAGVAWYLFPEVIIPFLGTDPLTSLKIIISGLVGLVLIIIGLLLVWIESEEIKEEGLTRSKRKK